MGNEEETELVTAIDGQVYRVLKNPPPPTPPWKLTAEEEAAVDAVARNMAKRVRRESIQVGNIRDLEDNEHACEKLDKIISDSLTSLKVDVKDEPAEKLFDKLGSTTIDWGDDAYAIGILFYRFFGTMDALVSYKRRFRGKEMKHFKYEKDEAFKILKARGLVRR